MDALMLWEYRYVKMPSIDMVAMAEQLNILGSVGWEVCGFTDQDPTLGVNQYCAILKRPRRGFDTPADPTPAWLPDPAGRHRLRWWDGLRWTERASTDGKVELDMPIP